MRACPRVNQISVNVRFGSVRFGQALFGPAGMMRQRTI
jgi:hypothetical protein